MMYTLLGRLVWMALKFFLRRRYSRMPMRRPLLLAAAAAAGTGAVAVARRRRR